MKRLLVAPILLFSLHVFCQENTMYPKEIGSTLYTSPIDSFRKGMDVIVGTGTLPDGSFKYISTSSKSWTAIMATSNNGTNRAITPLGKGYAGLKLRVKSVEVRGSKNRGYKYYLMVGGGNIVNYEVDLLSAISAGELVVNDRPATPGNNKSVADEIAKLKELLDKGVITQEEFDQQKKKLLTL